MRFITLGVIAITSTLTFACTTTTTTETTSGPGAAGSKGATAAATEKWQSKLALSKPGGLAKTIKTLASTKSAGAAPTRLSGSAGTDGGTCGLSTGDPTCDTCVDASCCAEDTACVNDADCSALIACGDACRDDACVNACMTAHPSGANLLNTFMTCMQNDCSAQCGSDGSSPPPPDGSGACGFASGDATCDTCLNTSCCSDADACLNDADCTALMDCGSACTDDACEAACETAHPEGTAKMNAISTCAENTCGTACDGATGGGGSGSGGGGAPPGGSCGLTSGDATCDTCLNASCCTQTTTCIDDTDCVALVRCYDACTDDACATACDTAHPSGLTKLDAVSTCAENTCATQCGF